MSFLYLGLLAVNIILWVLEFLYDSLNESVFGETAAAMSFKEIRRRDPYDDMSSVFCSRIYNIFSHLLTFLILYGICIA